jgi:hypothetical protein
MLLLNHPPRTHASLPRAPCPHTDKKTKTVKMHVEHFQGLHAAVEISGSNVTQPRQGLATITVSLFLSSLPYW